MRRRSSETDRGGGAGSREGSGSGGSDAAEGGNLGAEKPARSGVEEEEVLLSGDGGDAGVALRSEEESESKLRARGGRQVMRRSSMVAKQVISIESALGLGYIERIAVVSVNNDSIAFSSDEVIQWMHKIQEWNPKFFTLSHVPEKYRQAVSKFFRRVLIARMAESPDLASSYHRKLKEAYHTEEKLRDPEVVRRSKEHLIRLLDEIEDSLSKTYIAGEEFSMADRLSKTAYIAGEEFSMADVMFIPVLARLALLNLEDEYINSRPNMAKYWSLVQQRPSYKKVIGRYFGGWRKYRTLAKTWCFIRLRNTLKKY
ncbi:hypothetical protein EUGRSUZ_A01942 [Eucalyptus grandis]|uniref:Uncharacterized protein n=2 Tax=Eucalyptus grandis TaxID=71139 RepID=A0ACC3M6R7_EUCGR|nr:hypothetical protein EUGRSUZ_A01942 [Eucalyptus grandis]